MPNKHNSLKSEKGLVTKIIMLVGNSETNAITSMGISAFSDQLSVHKLQDIL